MAIAPVRNSSPFAFGAILIPAALKYATDSSAMRMGSASLR